MKTGSRPYGVEITVRPKKNSAKPSERVLILQRSPTTSRWPHTANRTWNGLPGCGEKREAILLYRDLLAMVHDRPEIYNELGQLFEFKGNVLQAGQNFERAIALKPDYLPALNNLGRLS
jgi:tetratricopeptide (TPR) repeat protein